MFGRVFNRATAKIIQLGAAAAVVSNVGFNEKEFQKKPDWYKASVNSLESRLFKIV